MLKDFQLSVLNGRRCGDNKCVPGWSERSGAPSSFRREIGFRSPKALFGVFIPRIATHLTLLFSFSSVRFVGPTAFVFVVSEEVFLSPRDDDDDSARSQTCFRA